MLITVGQLLHGPVGERLTDAAVLIRDGRIAEVGPRAEVSDRTPPDVPRHDFPGATLLPGLIDAHVHLSFDAGPAPVAPLLESDAPPDADALAGRAAQLLDCGVTTVRDLGDRAAAAVRLREAVEAGRCAGPRILAATAPLTPPSGHCWFLGGEVSGESAIRAMVRRNAAAGADVIKVMASGGHITEGGAPMWESQFSAAELAAVVDEAARYGLPVAAHAHGTPSIAAAVEAGVSTVEHCLWMDGPEEVNRLPEVAAVMARRGIAACGALCGNDWRAKCEKEGEEAARFFYGRLNWLDAHGVPLIMGTDAGIPGAAFDDYVSMLDAYAWLGFPAERIIELATVGTAGVLGLSGTTGRIAPGLDADLLVVDGDPRAGLAALRAVRLVMARGRTHPASGGVRPR